MNTMTTTITATDNITGNTVTTTTDQFATAVTDWFNAGDSETIALAHNLAVNFKEANDPQVPTQYREAAAARVAHLGAALDITVTW